MTDPLTIPCPACAADAGEPCCIDQGPGQKKIHLARGRAVGMTASEILAWVPRPPAIAPGPWIDGDLVRLLRAALEAACVELAAIGAPPEEVAKFRRIARCGDQETPGPSTKVHDSAISERGSEDLDRGTGLG